MPLEAFKQRWPHNVPGRFYVDKYCLDCDLCRETVPTVFTRDDSSGQSYVFKQPTTDEELNGCIEAMNGCPQGNVHGDGHLFDWELIPSEVKNY